MKYHIVKKSRNWNGSGYRGPSSNNKLCEFNSLEEAEDIIKTLLKYNPVGWDIYEVDHLNRTARPIRSVL